MKKSPFLNKKKTDKQDKSVLNRSAPCTTLCNSGNKPDIQINKIVTDLLAGNRICLQFKALISLMYFNALRISEALSITCYDIDSLGRIYIRGAKKSHNKLVTCPYYTSYFLDCKAHNRNPFIMYNRFFVYREFRKIGLIMQFDGFERSAVTHSLRFASIGNIKNEILTNEEISRFVGHKSEKTTEHYEKKKRKS